MAERDELAARLAEAEGLAAAIGAEFSPQDSDADSDADEPALESPGRLLFAAPQVECGTAGGAAGHSGGGGDRTPQLQQPGPWRPRQHPDGGAAPDYLQEGLTPAPAAALPAHEHAHAVQQAFSALQVGEAHSFRSHRGREDATHTVHSEQQRMRINARLGDAPAP